MNTVDQRLTKNRLDNAGINADESISNMRTLQHNYVKGKEPSCVASQITFDNALAIKGFELMFCIKPYESIDAIEISEHGIKAHISKKAQSK